MFYRVAFESANLLRMLLVIAALAASVVALGATMTPAHASFPGENGMIAFSEVDDFPGEDFEIYTMLPDGTDVRQVTDKEGRDQLPTWSPDGTKLGWVRSGQFWVHDFETGRQRMVVSIKGGVDSAVVWSPDGSKLAYSQARAGLKGADIFVMNADGTNQKNLTNTPSVEEWEVTWSPDGTKIAFTSTRRGNLDIYVMNADGTNPVNITDSMPEGMSVANASWSPDGTKIAFHTCLGENGQDCDIYVMNADGTKKPVNTTNRPEVYYGFGTDAGHTLDWQPLPGTTVPKSRSVTVHPPDTGGPSLLLVASALPLSVGVLLYAAVKRRI